MELIVTNNERELVSYYTIFHFLFGFIAGYIGIPLVYWVIIHLLFEIFENLLIRIPVIYPYLSQIDRTLLDYLNLIHNVLGFNINTELYKGDTILNSLGDNIFAILGWMIGARIMNKKLKYY
jgi:hypothetical protein